MYLAIDVGTGSLKAGLMLENRLFEHSVPLRSNLFGICVEQDPEEWLEGLAVLLPSLIKRAGTKASLIRAICVSGHSPSLVPVDASNRALRPCLTWQDRRAFSQAKYVEKVTGEFSDASFFAPKILWVKEEEPEVYAATKAFLQPKDFLIAHLTGEMIVDEVAARMYQVRALEEVDCSKLPRLVNNWAVVGETTASVRSMGLAPGIPVVAGGIDAYVEALGAGLVRPGQCCEAVGTSTCLSYCLDAKKEMPDATAHVIPRRALYILPMSCGGGTINWYLDTLGGGLRFVDLEDVLDQSLPGANGLLFLPYLTGERSPIWDGEAQGVFFGITRSHTAADFLRAVLEGTAFAVRHNVEFLSKRHLQPTEIRVTGGGAKLKAWNQIKADVTAVPYHKLELEQGALLGGILLCALAIEKRPVQTLVDEHVRVEDTFVPGGYSHIYDELYGKYTKLYLNTRGLMGRTERIMGG